MALFKVLIMSCLMLVFANKVMAETFCVSNSNELQSALSEAEGNAEDDEIRIVQDQDLNQDQVPDPYIGNFAYSTDEANSLIIRGGYISDCSDRITDPSKTVLDANDSGRVLRITGAVQTIEVEGITLQNGRVTTTNQYGGGLLVDADNSILTIKNNRVVNNLASNNGAGIYIHSAAKAVFINNSIINNSFPSSDVTPTSLGGGVCIFSSVEVSFINNVIAGNFTGRGGGIYINSAAKITLTNNTITLNDAVSGAGIYVNLIEDEDTASIYNNIIWNNDAIGPGNSLYIVNDGDNNDVVSVVNLQNNDFEQSADGTFIQVPFTIPASNLNNLNPLFVDLNKGDFHLQGGSPCIDKGSNSAPELPENDKAGKPRIINELVDMGAFEYGYTLKVAKEGKGTGIVTSSPEGINCGNDCKELYPEGVEVTLTATANPDFVFTQWSGSCSGSNTVVKVKMNSNKTCTATFKRKFTLTVEKEGKGKGTIKSNPEGINCGDNCSKVFTEDTNVALTATAEPGSQFGGWSGDCDQNGSVTIDSDKTCKARFDLVHTLTVVKDGKGNGTVTSKPAGINCGEVCIKDFVEGQEVTLTAVEDPGSLFINWSGDCDADGKVVMAPDSDDDGDKTCNALFDSTVGITPSNGTLGTTVTITGTGFGDKTGKVVIGKKMKIATWTDTQITGDIMAKKPAGVLKILLTKKGGTPVELSEIFTQELPVINTVSIDKLTREATVTGLYFSTKQGTVKTNSKTCKVIAGTWEMNKTTGDSSVKCTLHKKVDLEQSEISFKLKNAAGFTTFTYQNAQ